jgi:hypothetical protein
MSRPRASSDGSCGAGRRKPRSLGQSHCRDIACLIVNLTVASWFLTTNVDSLSDGGATCGQAVMKMTEDFLFVPLRTPVCPSFRRRGAQRHASRRGLLNKIPSAFSILTYSLPSYLSPPASTSQTGTPGSVLTPFLRRTADERD